MAESICFLDFPKDGQTGLTMRTIESMGVHTKLITTNKEILNYDFYNPNNIYILDLDDMRLPDNSFFNTKYEEINENIFNKYNIETWMDELLKYFER